MSDKGTIETSDTNASAQLESLKQGFMLSCAVVNPIDGSICHDHEKRHLEPRVMDVLVMLASRQGQVVTRDELMGEVWQGTLVTEDALARCIYQLRQQLPSILSVDDSVTLIETVHKRGYKLNLPVTLLTTTMSGTARVQSRRVNTTLVACLMIAVAIVAGTLFLMNNNVDAPERLNSIAVLAFTNMTGDDSYDYLADGFSEQLSHALANVENLKIAARTSAFYFRDHPANIPEIARQLDVEALLEGSIRINGGELRVTAQLIRADGFHMASHEYNRPLTDLLRLQSEVTDQILIELGITDDATATLTDYSPTDNFEAYDLYLQGRFELTHEPTESFARAAELFQQAIDSDANYALAYSGMADMYSLQLAHGQVTAEAIADKVESAISKALEIDDQLAEAHASRGLQRFTENLYAESEPHYRRAIELNPNYISAHNWLGLSLVYQDRFTEAIEAYQQAQRLDPLDAALNRNLGANLLLVGRPDEGFRYLERSQLVKPESARTYGMLLLWNSYYGRLNEAEQWRAVGLERFPEDREMQMQTVILRTLQGDWERADQTLKDARMHSPDNLRVILYGINLYLAADRREALDALIDSYAHAGSPFGESPPFGRTRAILRGLMIRLLQQNKPEEVIRLVNAYDMESALHCGVFGDPGTLMYLAHAHRLIDQEDEAATLIDSCMRDIDRIGAQRATYPRALYRMALTQTMSGQTEQGAATLKQAIELGWNHAWEAWHDPLWAPYRDLAPFNELFTDLKDRYGSSQN